MKQPMAQKNKILETIVGSHLYGTNTPTSDIDKFGIFIPDLKFFFGLETIEEVDLSTVSKGEDGKNNQDAVDIKLFSLNKFVKLCMENNPNIIEVLFSNKFAFIDMFGKILIQNKHLFPHRGLAQKFIGYARSQSHKMFIKSENIDSFDLAKKWLEEKLNEDGDQTKYTASQLLAEFRRDGIPGVKFHDHHASIGDCNISLTDKLSKVQNKILDRISKVGNRQSLYTKYGFDTKFSMHACRLVLEGIELLETGMLKFPLQQRDLLMDIRNGKWTKEEIQNFIDDGIKQIDSLFKTSKLPEKANFNEINELLFRMNMKYHFR